MRKALNTLESLEPFQCLKLVIFLNTLPSEFEETQTEAMKQCCYLPQNIAANSPERRKSLAKRIISVTPV